MPRRPMPWFRWYLGTVSDVKLRRLPAAQRWVWPAILEAARDSPEPPWLLVADGLPMIDRDIADLAALSLRETRLALAGFEAAQMITRDLERSAWRVTNFQRRQFASDDVTARTKKHRSKPERRNVPTTAPETETDTELPLTYSDTSPTAVDKAAGEGAGLIDDALALAAKRYGRSQVEHGKGRSAQALAVWWQRNEAEQARQRATALLSSHNLTATQLADALVADDPRWLNAYRRPEPT